MFIYVLKADDHQLADYLAGMRVFAFALDMALLFFWNLEKSCFTVFFTKTRFILAKNFREKFRLYHRKFDKSFDLNFRFFFIHVVSPSAEIREKFLPSRPAKKTP